MVISLDSYVGNNVQIRWHHDDGSNWAQYADVDDVEVLTAAAPESDSISLLAIGLAACLLARGARKRSVRRVQCKF